MKSAPATTGRWLKFGKLTFIAPCKQRLFLRYICFVPSVAKDKTKRDKRGSARMVVYWSVWRSTEFVPVLERSHYSYSFDDGVYWTQKISTLICNWNSRIRKQTSRCGKYRQIFKKSKGKMRRDDWGNSFVTPYCCVPCSRTRGNQFVSPSVFPSLLSPSVR